MTHSYLHSNYRKHHNIMCCGATHPATTPQPRVVCYGLGQGVALLYTLALVTTMRHLWTRHSNLASPVSPFDTTHHLHVSQTSTTVFPLPVCTQNSLNKIGDYPSRESNPSTAGVITCCVVLCNVFVLMNKTCLKRMKGGRLGK